MAAGWPAAVSQNLVANLLWAIPGWISSGGLAVWLGYMNGFELPWLLLIGVGTLSITLLLVALRHRREIESQELRRSSQEKHRPAAIDGAVPSVSSGAVVVGGGAGSITAAGGINVENLHVTVTALRTVGEASSDVDFRRLVATDSLLLIGKYTMSMAQTYDQLIEKALVSVHESREWGDFMAEFKVAYLLTVETLRRARTRDEIRAAVVMLNPVLPKLEHFVSRLSQLATDALKSISDLDFSGGAPAPGTAPPSPQ